MNFRVALIIIQIVLVIFFCLIGKIDYATFIVAMMVGQWVHSVATVADENLGLKP